MTHTSDPARLSARPVYLAGGINGLSDSDAKDWRAMATELLAGQVLDPMARDYRGKENDNVDAIVEGDKSDIDRCRAVIAYCPKPSWGTAMEVLYAYERRIPLAAVVPAGASVSPWLRYHATLGVVETVEQAAALAGDAPTTEPVELPEDVILREFYNAGLNGRSALCDLAENITDALRTAGMLTGVDPLPVRA